MTGVQNAPVSIVAEALWRGLKSLLYAVVRHVLTWRMNVLKKEGG